MKPGKTTEDSDLVIRTIDTLCVHDYLEDGAWEFLKCFLPNELTGSSPINNFVLTAEMWDEVIGTIEIRDKNHISLFCVEKEYRRRGIGRKLLYKALELCVQYHPNIAEISVNSLHGTVHIYKRLGFQTENTDWMDRDIPYTPMLFDLSKEDVQAIVGRSHH
ncbi:MAG: GNAT family N-acetyltransferase [Syntrophaceae bacterium]